MRELKKILPVSLLLSMFMMIAAVAFAAPTENQCVQNIGELVGQTLSKELKDAFAPYLASLNQKGRNGFGVLSVGNYGEYLLKYFLMPSENKYLGDFTDAERSAYLATKMDYME